MNAMATIERTCEGCGAQFFSMSHRAKWCSHDCKHGVKLRRISIVELRRMKQLADLSIPCGSIAKLVSHEFGTARTAEDVRQYLRRNYGWRSQRRGATA